MALQTHTPGPWEYVPSTKHHGPYVTSEFGTTIADCYVMSNPHSASVLNGGDSRPIHHLHEMADPNARLIAAAPELFAALKECAERFEKALIHSGTDPEFAAAAVATYRAILSKVQP